MKKRKRRPQVTCRWIEYDLYGLSTWWPESLSESECAEVCQKLAKSGCRFMVHVIKIENPIAFVEPMEMPIASTRSQVDSQNRSDSN